MTSTSNLFLALAEASKGISPLTEDGRAEYGGGGYSYISAPGAVRALKPALLSVGLLPTITGCQIVEVAGKQVAELRCLLVHLPSGESLRDVFALPTAPGRGRDEGKAAQAAITSGLGRWLRCLLLAVQAGEDEIDTSRPTSSRPAEAQSAPQTADERQLHARAKSMGVSVDMAASWATRVESEGGKKTAIVGTLEGVAKEGMLAEAAASLAADLETAKQRGMSPRQFGEKVVRPWCSDQIPF